MIEGIVYAKNHKQVRWVIIYSAVILSLFGYQLFIIQPSVIKLGFAIKYLAFVYASVWLLEAGVYWNAYRILARFGEKRTLFIITSIHACCFLALSVINEWFGIVFIIINYFGRGLFYPATNNFAQKHIVSSHRATVLSVSNFIMAIVASITLFLFGVSTDAVGINMTYLFVGLAVVLSALLLYATYPESEVA